MNERPQRKHVRPKQQEVEVKATDEVLQGVYSNIMRITHSKEEFVLDFMNIMPGPGTLNARVIVSPGHLKRMVAALQDNLRKYETRYGQLEEAHPPKLLEAGSDDAE